jgi:hypothetical protein
MPHPVYVAHSRLDGQVVVAGGIRGDGSVGEDVAWAGLLDPTTGRTTLIDPPSRIRPLSVELADGRVVLVGGDAVDSPEPMRDAEILE